MQTNHLSHFLLTKELLPLLNKAAAAKGEARIVNHSSGARKFPSTPLQAKYLGKNGGNLGGNGNSMLFGGARWQRYHQACTPLERTPPSPQAGKVPLLSCRSPADSAVRQTKLANVVFTLGLHDRLQAAGSRVKALCAAPGLAATNLQVPPARALEAQQQHVSDPAEPKIGRVRPSASSLTERGWCSCAPGPSLLTRRRRRRRRHRKVTAQGRPRTAPCRCSTVRVSPAPRPSLASYEPGGIFSGPAARTALEPVCTDAAARRVLWEESSKAVGEFVVG